MASYQIRVYDTAGNLQAVSGLQNDVRSVNIEHRVNTPSNLMLGLAANGDMANVLDNALDYIIEIRRNVPEAGLSWYTEYVGFHRTSQYQITTSDSEIFTSYSRGLLDLIKRRSVRYHADTDGSTKGPAPADDVMKQYVRENAGPLATIANGRLSDGVTPGLAVAADVSQAASFEGSFAYDNLLDTLQRISASHSVDFDVEWGGPASPIDFTFVTYFPFRGTDRRVGTAEPAVFAPNLGNMSDIFHTHQRTDEATSVLVLGPGESVFRDTTLRVSPRVTDSPWNLSEYEHSASGEDRQAALEAIGDEQLYERGAKISVPFIPLQTRVSTYGRHYRLGDAVSVRVRNTLTHVKIKAVTLNLSERAESVGLELEEIV